MYYEGKPSFGTDDEKMNNRFKSLLSNNKKDIGGESKPLRDQPKGKISSGGNPLGPMSGDLMTWTQMLESMDDIQSSITKLSTDINNDQIDSPSSEFDDSENSEKEILAELNQIFTPILVMQGFEGDMSENIQEAFSEASILTEKNIIKFDDETRLAQLISVCASLLQKRKNTEKWQMYKKAAAIRNQMKLDMQKEEYDAAKTLAQKFLISVANTNNSSVARKAANDLLPATT